MIDRILRLIPLKWRVLIKHPKLRYNSEEDIFVHDSENDWLSLIIRENELCVAYSGTNFDTFVIENCYTEKEFFNHINTYFNGIK